MGMRRDWGGFRAELGQCVEGDRVWVVAWKGPEGPQKEGEERKVGKEETVGPEVGRGRVDGGKNLRSIGH